MTWLFVSSSFSIGSSGDRVSMGFRGISFSFGIFSDNKYLDFGRGCSVKFLCVALLRLFLDNPEKIFVIIISSSRHDKSHKYPSFECQLSCTIACY